MKSKIITLGKEAREKLIKGVDKLADAVKVTLGPEGKTVILASYQDGEVKITKDGVSVANEVFLSDKIENTAAQIVKEVASKTASDAGDGTTTATVLAQALIHACERNDSSFLTELISEKDKVVEFIKNSSKKITISDQESVINIASISANNNKEIGELVAEAYSKTGEFGIVSVEEGDSFETEIKLTQGVNFDSGFISPNFINNKEKLITEYSDVMIFLYDDVLTRTADILPQLRIASAAKKNLLVIASDISSEALAAMIANKSFCVAVKAPSFGDYRKSMMIDIATATGGQYIEARKNYDFRDLNDTHFGYAEKIIITKDETTIIGGKGKKVTERINQLNLQVTATENEYEKNIMKKRIAQLAGGVAVIKVGGYSQIEIKEKKDRIEDAIFAVKAALEEGIVEGGGVTYLRARNLVNLPEMREALAAPFRQIASNAEIPNIDSLQNEITNGYVKGFNAKTKRTADMFEEGIIDPAKVTRVALENAVSIATTFLTTECIIVEE